MPVIAVANAALREIGLQPVFGAAAQPLSGLTLAALLALYSFVMLQSVLGSAARSAAWLLGVTWTALTLAFEYTLLAAQHANPLAGLLDALSLSAISAGNLFALAVLVVLLAPPVFTPRAAPAT